MFTIIMIILINAIVFCRSIYLIFLLNRAKVATPQYLVELAIYFLWLTLSPSLSRLVA